MVGLLEYCGIQNNEKLLMYFLGEMVLYAINLTLVEERVNSVIKKLVFFLESYHIGLVLVVNSICMLKLCYILFVLRPPQYNIPTLERVFIDFLRQGRHLIKSDRLYVHTLYAGCPVILLFLRLSYFFYIICPTFPYRSRTAVWV